MKRTIVRPHHPTRDSSRHSLELEILDSPMYMRRRIQNTQKAAVESMKEKL